MRVKRLEIQGFKSFKDKTIIHFDHDITGIVGPNGCGKSNIVDAFFWVMGEQSYKHMRGSGSSDLIFNGSSKFAPLGVAEATLVLETDYVDTENAPSGATVQDVPIHLRTKEVSVTRRVFRTGEGEYLINGVPARLKDIQELFMDTGAGAKGYSVIEQGQIDRVVNSKPEDRRRLIEEAAGIAKYKARKKESLRKIEQAQGNLSRLNDVIQEIDRNLGSLERQAQKARRYKEHKEALFEKEIKWGRRKLAFLGQSIDELKKKRETFEQEIVALRAELSTAENEIEVERTLQLDETKIAESKQLAVRELNAKLTEKRSQLELSRQRQADLKRREDNTALEIQSTVAQVENEEQKVTQLQLALREAMDSAMILAASVQEFELELEAQRSGTEEARKNLDDVRARFVALVRENSQLSADKASAEARIQSTQGYLEKTKILGAQLSSKMESLKEQKIRVEADILGLDQTLEQARSEDQTTQERWNATRSDLEAALKEQQDIQVLLTRTRSEYETLNKIVESYEGLTDASKAALAWSKEQANEGNPALKMLVETYVVQPSYEEIVETWLELFTSHLVSSDVSHAIQALTEIKAKNQGRASVWIESSAAGADASVGGLEASKAVEWLGTQGISAQSLSEVVSVENSLPVSTRLFAEKLVQNVVILESVSDLEKAVQNSNAAELTGIGIVTRDGFTKSADGTLRGGSRASLGEVSLLGRKSTLQSLFGRLEQLTLDSQSLSNKVDGLKAQVSQLEEQKRESEKRIQSEEIRKAGILRDLSQLESSLEDLLQEKARIDNEVQEQETIGRDANEKLSEIAARMSRVDADRESLEETIRLNDAKVQSAVESLRALETQYQLKRVEEASVNERKSGLEREIESQKKFLESRRLRLNDLKQETEQIIRESNGYRENDSGLEVLISELAQALADADASLSDIKNRLEISNQKTNSCVARIKELHTVGDQKTAEANHLALEIERIVGDRAHLIQNIEEKYGQGCLERVAEVPEQTEWSEPIVTAEMTREEEAELEQEVEELREKIRRLGEVNPMALEEFEELKKRHEHLLAEREDLNRSIKDLEDAIDHINKTSVDRFKKAFEAVANRFERLFPIIFGGGQAQLTLVYPEGVTDILEAGIDIFAQPPGKKVVNISLLSGGEKALTAIALVFSIFMVKPSPFCILDEVDAPLDDTNIGKFNAILKEMSRNTQFIIITHNKKTMELNDTLYGVTMEEPGVSKMVSIELH